jgi:hypothetical protein
VSSVVVSSQVLAVRTLADYRQVTGIGPGPAAARWGAYRGGVNTSPRDPRRQVHSVTSAPPSLRDDQHERMVRYLVSMGIRTACFILAVVFMVWLHWTIAGWVFIGLAAVLPYVAVVMANAARVQRVDVLAPVTPADDPRRQLPGRGPRQGLGGPDEPRSRS